MKSKFFLLVLSLSLLAFSCTETKHSSSADEIVYDSTIVKKIIKLDPNRQDSLPCATLDIQFTYPTAFGTKEDLQKLQSIFCEIVLGEGYAEAKSPQEAVEKYISQYTDSYRKDLEEVYGDAIDEMLESNSAGLNFAQITKNKIVFANKNLLSFTNFGWEYTGGVHGLGSQTNHSINTQTIEPITLNQIFSADYEMPLTEIIKEKLLKVAAEKAKERNGQLVSNDEELKTLFEYDSVEVTDNFMLTESAIVFTYNPYAIASYSMGQFDVQIPYTEIAHLLYLEAFAKFFPDMDLQEQANANKEALRVSYNDFPVAYVKNSKLYFFNPENQTTLPFKEEPDSVFNCVYSDNDAMFYYTVVRDGDLCIKQVDLSTNPVQPMLLVDLAKPADEFFSETYGEKAKLFFIKNNVLLQTGFNWDCYCFRDYIECDLVKQEVHLLDGYAYYEKYLEDEEPDRYDKDYKFIYQKAKQLDLTKYMTADEEPFEIEYYYVSASADGSKIAFFILTGFGDLPHGPYCIANADGTKLQLLEHTDAGSSFKPLWSNNNVVYTVDYPSETEKDEEGDPKWVSELRYSRADDNSVITIDKEGASYYAVRKKTFY